VGTASAGNTPAEVDRAVAPGHHTGESVPSPGPERRRFAGRVLSPAVDVWQSWSRRSVDNGAGARIRRATGRTEGWHDRLARDALSCRGNREEWRKGGSAGQAMFSEHWVF